MTQNPELNTPNPIETPPPAPPTEAEAPPAEAPPAEAPPAEASAEAEAAPPPPPPAPRFTEAEIAQIHIRLNDARAMMTVCQEVLAPSQSSPSVLATGPLTESQTEAIIPLQLALLHAWTLLAGKGTVTGRDVGAMPKLIETYTRMRCACDECKLLNQGRTIEQETRVLVTILEEHRAAYDARVTASKGVHPILRALGLDDTPIEIIDMAVERLPKEIREKLEEMSKKHNARVKAHNHSS